MNRHTQCIAVKGGGSWRTSFASISMYPEFSSHTCPVNSLHQSIVSGTAGFCLCGRAVALDTGLLVVTYDIYPYDMPTFAYPFVLASDCSSLYDRYPVSYSMPRTFLSRSRVSRLVAPHSLPIPPVLPSSSGP